MEDAPADLCRICGARDQHEHFTAREMMFGTREPFDYFRCGECGTLQIARFPDDIARFYDSASYYSFNNKGRRGFPARLVRRVIAALMVGRPSRYPKGNSAIDRLKRRCDPWIALIPGLRRGSTILDVGCGEGARLSKLAEFGFINLSGVDPYMPKECAGKTPAGVELIPGELAQVERKFDLVTMHHSVEHFENPGEMLALARERLNPRGRLFVTIPVLQDEVWQRYGVNWAQLDAPRHYYLFPADTFISYAKQHGLRCVAHGYNSLGWALAWSAAYARDLSATELPFDRQERESFDREAVDMNARGAGEAGWFLLEAA